MEYFVPAMIFLGLVGHAFGTRSVVQATLCGFGSGAIGIFGLVIVVDYFDTGVWQLPDDVVERWIAFALFGGLWGGIIGCGIALTKKIPALSRRAGNMLGTMSDSVSQSRREQKAAGQQAYDSIARELEEGRIESSTWVKALERSDGNEGRAKAEYIRLRRRALLERWARK